MSRKQEEFLWEIPGTGKRLRIGATRAGRGPLMLMLPALSSISTRDELWPLQSLLSDRYETLAVDWPGFGVLPRPKHDWQPDDLRAFLRFLLTQEGQPAVTLAAGHGGGYALAQAAAAPGSLGRLVLLSPTWRGPLPTMMMRRSAAFRAVARGVDVPVAGAGFYRLNVNSKVIGMMARAHVYSDPGWLNADRMDAKRLVTEAPGARYSSFRFVAGELDPFQSSESFLAAGQAAGPLVIVHGAQIPRKSRAEIKALAALPQITEIELSRGKLSSYEEFPAELAESLTPYL